MGNSVLINRFNFLLQLEKFFHESIITLKLGYPLIISQLLMTIIEFVDSVMSGNISSVDLAGFAIASAIFHPIFLLVLGMLIPLGSIIAQLFGAKKPGEIIKNVIQALWLSQFFAFLSILFFVNIEFVLDRIGYEQEVIVIAKDYLTALCWGIPAIYAFLVLRMFIEGLSITRPTMYFSIIGLGVKIILNYFMMFGGYGFQRLGAVGAGWATSITYWIMLFVMFFFCIKSKLFVKFRKFLSFRKPTWLIIREILRIGLPHGLGFAAETALFTSVSLMMATFGVTAIAGHQIALNVASLTFMVPMGVSIAISIRLGHAKGRGNLKEMSYVGFSGILLCILLMAITAVAIFLLSEKIAGFYTEDLDVINLAVNLLYMAAIFQLSDGMQVGALGALRGLKDTRVPFATNIFSYWVVGIPVAYFVGIHYKVGPIGMWWGLIVGLSIAALLHSFRFRILIRRLLSQSVFDKIS